jgi:hypothetical protein
MEIPILKHILTKQRLVSGFTVFKSDSRLIKHVNIICYAGYADDILIVYNGNGITPETVACKFNNQ